jgi:hypothetical protein
MVPWMRLPRLFPAKEDLDQAERLLVQAFRSLGVLCGRLADRVEAQRLARSGYASQGKFLERLEPPSGSDGASP